MCTMKFGAATADLFVGRPWVVVPGDPADTFAIELVEALARATGAQPVRMDAATVAEYLSRQWCGRIIAPDAELYESLTAAAATAGVMGGGTYDALVGLTAHSFGHELLSLDLRAERTYRSLGIAYRLLDQ